MTPVDDSISERTYSMWRAHGRQRLISFSSASSVNFARFVTLMYTGMAGLPQAEPEPTSFTQYVQCISGAGRWNIGASLLGRCNNRVTPPVRGLGEAG